MALLLASSLQLPQAIAFPLAIAISTFVGLAIDLIIFRPMSRRGARSHTLLLASLGAYLVIQNVISMFWGDDTIRILARTDEPSLLILGAKITPVQLLLVLGSVILFTFYVIFMKSTATGRLLRSIANDEELTQLCGIDTNRCRSLAFVIASAMAAIASLLISLETDLNPGMGFKMLVMGFVSIIVGGRSSFFGPALGALTVSFAQNFGSWGLPTKWQDSIAFLLLIIILVLRPEGLIGIPAKKT